MPQRRRRRRRGARASKSQGAREAARGEHRVACEPKRAQVSFLSRQSPLILPSLFPLSPALFCSNHSFCLRPVALICRLSIPFLLSFFFSLNLIPFFLYNGNPIRNATSCTIIISIPFLPWFIDSAGLFASDFAGKRSPRERGLRKAMFNDSDDDDDVHDHDGDGDGENGENKRAKMK